MQQSKIEEIIAKYGELQADGDTIKLKDNGYTVSLKEIYNGTTSNSGGSTGESTGSEELENLKAELAKTNATEDKILEEYKAYSNGKLLTGEMKNYEGKTVTANTITENGDNTEITIPLSGYYSTNSKVSVSTEAIKENMDNYIITSFFTLGEITLAPNETHEFKNEIPKVEGYKPVFVIPFSAGSWSWSFAVCGMLGNNVNVVVQSFGSTITEKAYPTVNIVYVKSDN